MSTNHPFFVKAEKNNPLQIQYLQGVSELGQRDSNPRVQESKSCALPLGDGPLFYKKILAKEQG